VLTNYRKHGGTVVFSSHVMDTVERLCDHVAIVVAGNIAAKGTIADVRGQGTLEDAFIRYAGAPLAGTEQLDWLSA
jgi:ABC-2 type transport system ATP-binding protein